MSNLGKAFKDAIQGVRAALGHIGYEIDSVDRALRQNQEQQIGAETAEALAAFGGGVLGEAIAIGSNALGVGIDAMGLGLEGQLETDQKNYREVAEVRDALEQLSKDYEEQNARLQGNIDAQLQLERSMGIIFDFEIERLAQIIGQDAVAALGLHPMLTTYDYDRIRYDTEKIGNQMTASSPIQHVQDWGHLDKDGGLDPSEGPGKQTQQDRSHLDKDGGMDPGENGTSDPHARHDSVRPVVLDLNNDGISLTPETSSNTFFDTAGDGYQHRTAWAGAGDAVLAVDADKDGKIDQKDEIAFTEWDPTATDDLQALQNVFDTNHNGWLDNGEDVNKNGKLDAGEDLNGNGKLDATGDDKFGDFKLMITGADGQISTVALSSLVNAIRLTPGPRRKRPRSPASMRSRAASSRLRAMRSNAHHNLPLLPSWEKAGMRGGPARWGGQAASSTPPAPLSIRRR